MRVRRGLVTGTLVALMVLTLVLVPAVPVLALGEVDPNGDFGYANSIPLDTPVSGTINPAGDHDWFKVNIATPGVLTASLTSVPSGIRATLDMYDKNKSYLLGETGSMAGDDVEISYNVIVPGYYYLRVKAYSGSASSLETYVLTVTHFIVSDPYEPNNSFGQAADLALDTPVEPYIFRAADEDWFKVNIASPGILTFSVTSAPAAMRGRIDLYNKDKTHLGNAQASNNGDNVFAKYDVVQPGWYYAKVTEVDYWSEHHTSTYTLTATQTVVNDTHEPNNIFGDATQITLGTPVEGYIFTIPDEDWYRVSVPSPGVLTFSLTGVPSSMRGRIDIYDKNRGYLTNAQATNDGDDVSASYDVADPGWYYAKVTEIDYWSQRHTSTYTFTASQTVVTDVNEPNNGFGSATTLNLDEPTQGYIFRGGDEDYYRIVLPSAGLARVSLTDLPPNMRGRLRLYDREYSHVKTVDATNRQRGDSFFLEWDAAEAGPYYVIVTDYNGERHTTSYVITATHTPVVDPYEPNNDFGNAYLLAATTFSAYFFPGSDSDWYRGYVETPGTVTVSLTAVPPNIRGHVRLYNADNSYLASITATDVGYDVSLSYDVSEAGYYYVQVYDYNNARALGTYTLSIAGMTLSYPAETPVVAEADPNGAFRYANLIDLDTAISGTINPAGDYDWFKVNVPTPGVLTASVTSVPVDIRATVYLYNRHNSSLGGQTASLPGDDVTVSYDVIDPGYYYIRINAYSGASFSLDPYELTVTHTEVNDAYEPNNSFGRAVSLALDTPIQPYIFRAGDEDWFKINVPSPGVLALSITGAPAEMRGRIDLYNKDKTHRGSAQASNNGDNVSFSYDVIEPGTYYAKITEVDYWSDRHTSTYTLTATQTVVNDTHEPNNVFGDATPVTLTLAAEATLDAAVQGYIFRAGDDDWYKVNIAVPGVLTFSLTDVPAAMRGRIEIRNDNNDYLVATQATNDGDDVSLSYDVIEAGWYYAKISEVDYWSERHTSTYTLTTTQTVVNDVHEPNGSAGSATPLSLATPTQGYIFRSGDEDYYRVTVPSAGELRLAMSAVPLTMRGRMRLYDQEYSHLVTVDATSTGDSFSLYWDAPGPGSYYVLVSDYNNQRQTEMYTITATHTPVVDVYEANNQFGDAYLLTAVTINPYFFPGSDHDWFRGYVATPGTVTIDVTGAPANIRTHIRLYDASYYYLNSITATDDGYDVSLSHAVPAVGYYFIEVYDYSNRRALDTYTMTVTGIEVASDVTSPPIPELLSPLDGVSVPDATPTLDWSDVLDPSGVTYTLEVDDSPGVISPILTRTGLASSEYTLEAGEALAEGSYYWRVNAIDGQANESGWTGIWSFVVDLTAPDAVSDLAIGGTTPNTMTLNWTAPGDDGSVGTAAEYDVRYSTAPINDGNWDAASQCTGEPSPQVAGSAETFTVSNLDFGTLYYVGLKTIDEAGNRSALSNVVSATTGAAVTVTAEAPTQVVEATDFTATVAISGVENLDAASYSVSFDPALLQITNVTSGDIGGTPIPVDIWHQAVPGTVNVVQNVPGTPGVTGSGNLAVLHFHVIGPNGSSSAIAFSNGVLGDNAAQEIPAVWVDDSVSVSSTIPGDANGDGVVNALDITKTERIIAGVDPPSPGADANGDGNINALDITTIELIIAGLL